MAPFFCYQSEFFAIRFRCLLPAISDRLRFLPFSSCVHRDAPWHILRGTSVGGEHVAHLVCMARKESVECVEVEFLPSATDGGEHTFTSGMGDQRAPLPVPLANLLFQVPFFFASSLASSAFCFSIRSSKS